MPLILVAAAAVAATVFGGRAARRFRTVRRLRLRRADGRVYLDRWGISTRIGGVYLHRMAAPDPGRDVHDHPWPFVTVVLRGGYIERRCPARAVDEARYEARKPFRPRVMRLDEAHTITALPHGSSWSLVLHGQRVRPWGFYVVHPSHAARWTWVAQEIYKRLPNRPLGEERAK